MLDWLNAFIVAEDELASRRAGELNLDDFPPEAQAKIRAQLGIAETPPAPTPRRRRHGGIERLRISHMGSHPSRKQEAPKKRQRMWLDRLIFGIIGGLFTMNGHATLAIGRALMGAEEEETDE